MLKMKKIKPTVDQMRNIVVCYLEKIVPPYNKAESTLPYVKEHSKGVKEFFGLICFNYTMLSVEDTYYIDEVLRENECIRLHEIDMDSFKPTVQQLQKNEGYVYLNDFCKHIMDLKYYGHTEEYPKRTKEDPNFSETSLSRGLVQIKNRHKDTVNSEIDWYLSKTASQITNLSPLDFNKIDEIARKNGMLTIKEAYDKFPAFRKEFKEQKQSIESPEYLDWRGSGNLYSSPKKIKPTLNQMRKIVITYLNYIATDYINEVFQIKKYNTKLVKNYFNAIYINYQLLAKSEKLFVDVLLRENFCIPLQDLDTEAFLPSKKELDKYPGYDYLHDYCLYIQDVEFSGSQKKCLRSKEHPFISEGCLSDALSYIRKSHKDSINDEINWYLRKVANAVATLPNYELRKIDAIAKINKMPSIAEAINSYSFFKKGFNEKIPQERKILHERYPRKTIEYPPLKIDSNYLSTHTKNFTPPATNKAIIEETFNLLGVYPPPVYMEFLERYNFLGFYWTDNEGSVNPAHIEAGPFEEPQNINALTFYGTCQMLNDDGAIILSQDCNNLSLLEKYFIYEDWFQDTKLRLLPFCEADYGDFCFIINEDNTLGAIYRVALGAVDWSSTDERVLSSFDFIANSFYEFLYKLTTPEINTNETSFKILSNRPKSLYTTVGLELQRDIL